MGGLPSLGPRGETHSLAGEGVGGPYSEEGTDTLYNWVKPEIVFVIVIYLGIVKDDLHFRKIH